MNNSFINYFFSRIDEVAKLALDHIQITGMAVTLAILIGVPTGIFITRRENLAKPILGIAGMFQTIPSLALFGLIIPFLGIGVKPAIFVLFLFALLPIITNTYIGIRNIDDSLIEAGTGMGMTNFQILKMIELPMALPVMMGGIRISAVANIGTATIAALIGAGGLGELIFRGISTSNNNLVLTGALPTALLAFTINYILGIVEKALIPAGISGDREGSVKNKKILKVLSVFVVLIVIFSAYTKFTKEHQPTIKVGHKAFTEQRILGQMIGLVIEDGTKYKADIIELGGTNVNFEALKSGEIDLYPEYTGTAYSAVLGQKGLTVPEMVYDYVKENYEKNFNLTFMKPMKFSNSYAFVMKREKADKYGIEKISDLKNFSDRFTVSGSPEFMEREDGFLGVQKAYNLKFKDRKSMDPGLIISSLDAGKIDVGVAFSTDGRIAKYGLKVIKDDRNFFPPYNIAINIPVGFDKKYPNVYGVLGKLQGIITDEEMQEMNLKSIDGVMSEREIASEYLKKNNLIK